MADERSVWNLTPSEWEQALRKAQADTDALEDGAFVREDPSGQSGAPELIFFATSLNKPAGWQLPFVAEVPGSRRQGTMVGHAWYEPPTGFVQFEVFIPAAAEAIGADYESGASDMDYVAYEQAAEQAVRGTPADEIWLRHEFGRLISLIG